MNNEIQLIKKIKTKGSKEAANELVSKYYKQIYIYIYKQIACKELSMDLTQDIFVSMLKSIENFNHKKSSFRTWLYKIATYKIVDYYRSKDYKHNKVSICIDDIEILDEEDILCTLEYRQDLQQVIGIVNTFDTVYQQIFRLKIFGQYTFCEISRMLKIPESTIKTKYYSLLRKIKTIYKE